MANFVPFGAPPQTFFQLPNGALPAPQAPLSPALFAASPIESLPPPHVDPFLRYSEANEDTDILLVSSNDVHFHVNSVVMKLSSTVFKDMLSMPRPLETPVDEKKSRRNSEKDAIPLSENSDVLCLLLDIIYPGRGLSKDLDILSDRPVLPLLKAAGLAAVKYDMASALISIRAFLVSQEVVSKYNAVQLYGIAWDLDFIEESKRLSTETLKCNLNTLNTEKYLDQMNITAVLKLQKLHRLRRIVLLNSLTEMVDGKPFYDNAGLRYGSVGLSYPDQMVYAPVSFAAPWQLLPQSRKSYGAECYEWTLLITEVSRIMEECPDGTDFFRDGDEFFFNEKFARLRNIMDLRKLAKEFRHIFAGLPKAIDV